MSKHDNIIQYIKSLKPGVKISVRSIAGYLNVSDGTAYRAIKDCEESGIVSTIPRVGTVRVDKVEKKNEEFLTYADVVNIVNGTILGGKCGIHKMLSNFFIGAMTGEAASKFIKKSSLVIVGNREELQRLALINDCGVLISGDFNCSDDIKKLANERCLPIISSNYDTFTIASMINKAISENIIKKDIILIEDIMTEAKCMNKNDTIKMFKDLVKQTKHERFPVLDDDKKLIGIITLRDLNSLVKDEQKIEEIMTKSPITVFPKTTVAYAAHIMVWEDIKICPVIDKKKLVGVVTRKDVMKALEYASRQSHVKETMEDLILENFKFKMETNKMHFYGKIIPEMLNQFGTASTGAINMLLSTTAEITLQYKNNVSVYIDNFIAYFMKPVQIDRDVDIYVEIIDMGRNSCKAEIDMCSKNNSIIAKAILSAKILN